MKKLNQSGFVLAETLIVTVFLMTLFTMVYKTVLPLMGKYEEREVYDDVDSKYSIYWIKKMIESSSYNHSFDVITSAGYFRFECKDFAKDSNSQNMCKDIVKAMGINNCDKNGDNCDIYITNYRIGNTENKEAKTFFKNVIRQDTEKFSSGFKSYILYLPDYQRRSLTGAQYRVFAVFHHLKDSNNYYSYATIEIKK